MKRDRVFAIIGAYVTLAWAYVIIFPRLQMPPPLPALLVISLLPCVFAGAGVVLILGVLARDLRATASILVPSLVCNCAIFGLVWHVPYPTTYLQFECAFAFVSILCFGIWCMLRARWPNRYLL